MIIRNYGCTDCNLEWEVTVEDSSAPDPDCPRCSQVLEWVPTRINIGTYKSKAVDYAQDVLEKDFGLSNFNDNTREGDTVFKAPPPPSVSERDALEREVREYVAQTTTPVNIPVENQPLAGPKTFWSAQPAAPMIPMQAALAGAAQPAYHRGQLVMNTGNHPDNPMHILQGGIKSGHATMKSRIVGRWKP